MKGKDKPKKKKIWFKYACYTSDMMVNSLNRLSEEGIKENAIKLATFHGSTGAVVYYIFYYSLVPLIGAGVGGDEESKNLMRQV